VVVFHDVELRGMRDPSGALENRRAKRFAYEPSPAAPNGTITNDGGVDILGPEGKRRVAGEALRITR
jgi:hypothetical protein